MATFRQPSDAYMNKQVQYVKDQTEGLGEINPLAEEANAQLLMLMKGGWFQNMKEQIDEQARLSYQQAAQNVNQQAGMSRDAAFDALARRGIAGSSEAPAAMSVLEAQRIRSIQDTARGIEGQRLGHQVGLAGNMPGQLAGIGQYGQAQTQQNIANQLGAIGMGQQYTLGTGALGLQAGQLTEQSNQADAAQDLATWTTIGQAAGDVASLAMGMPPPSLLSGGYGGRGGGTGGGVPGGYANYGGYGPYGF